MVPTPADASFDEILGTDDLFICGVYLLKVQCVVSIEKNPINLTHTPFKLQ